MLPRKKITIPVDMLKSATRGLQPTFRVGPILSFRDGPSQRPLLPPPDLVGLVSEYVHELREEGQPPTYASEPIPPLLPMSELPRDRVELDEGWLRLLAAAPPQAPQP